MDVYSNPSFNFKNNNDFLNGINATKIGRMHSKPERKKRIIKKLMLLINKTTSTAQNEYVCKRT